MKDRTDLITGVIQAAGGKVIGQIRMQKIFYLLEQLGLSANIRYSYHHFGPYSEDLARSIDYAELIDSAVKEVPDRTISGSTFIAYELSKNLQENPDKIGDLSFSDVKNFVKDMTAETSIVIELAATIHWLKNKEKIDNWEQELLRRKPSKATPVFVEKAKTLLGKLNLAA